MRSSALNRGSPIISWFPVVHIKRCLGFLIMSPMNGIYLRFGLIHAFSNEAKTVLQKWHKFFKQKLSFRKEINSSSISVKDATGVAWVSDEMSRSRITRKVGCGAKPKTSYRIARVKVMLSTIP